MLDADIIFNDTFWTHAIARLKNKISRRENITAVFLMTGLFIAHRLHNYGSISFISDVRLLTTEH